MDKTIAPRSKGNDSAMTVIDECRGMVHDGVVAYVAAVLVKDTNELVTVHGGRAGLEFTAMGGAEMLKDVLKDELRKRTAAPDVKEPLYNYAYYNCTSMPLAFDFLPVLLQAEMQRARRGAPAPLRVAFFWGANPDSNMRTPWQKQCYNGLLLLMPELIGAVVDNYALSSGFNMGETHSCTSFFPIVERYNRGESIPRIVAPKAASKKMRDCLRGMFGDQAPVTITLRDTQHHPFRNSNVPEWVLFAEWLKDRGEKVVFVRDTRNADEPIAGQMTMPIASKELHARVALYEQAKCNMFVSNGPAMLPVFMDCPWLFFNVLTDDREDFKVNTSEGWRKSTGIEPGGQWPWARPNQRIIWHEDKFEHMQKAWLEVIKPEYDFEAHKKAAFGGGR